MRSVVITGAGSGIGAATVVGMDRDGRRVFAGVVDIELGADGLHALVDNAGKGFAGPLETLPIENLREQFEVNVVGQVAVTQAFLPMLRRSDHPRIVLVGSVGGLVAVGFAGAYHASKYAMEAIADAWRQELSPDGVQVALVEPGPLATPIWSKAAHSLNSLPASERYRERIDALRDRLQRMGKQSPGPDQAVELITHAVTAVRPRTRYAGGVAAKVVPKVRRLVPDRLFDRVAQHVTT